MNEQSKKGLAEAPKVLGLAVWFILAAATCSGVWGYCTEKTICVFATILFAWNLGLIVHYGLKLAKDKDKLNAE